jgi:predicted esterase
MNAMTHTPADPHAGQPVFTHGPKPADARLTVVLAHGRGGSAEDMLGLAHEFQLQDVAYVAPQAAGHTWYPYSFLSPLEKNEPGLSSALDRLGDLVRMLETKAFPARRVALLGFSQGACLALEFAARHARRYGAVIGFSGGLIGPPGTPRQYAAALDGTPVFLGCSDVDPHIPLARVHETAAAFEQLGASVDERIYPQMGHTVNRDELDAAAALLAGIPGR